MSPSSVLKWIDSGKLRAFRTPGGHRRIAADALVGFLRAHQLPVPAELEAGVVRLLVIDDEARFLRTLAEVLRRADPNLVVETAHTALDGLLKVGLVRPHAVLLDAYMPGMHGLEVCKHLKASKTTAQIAVLAMSGQHSAELERQFQQAGAAAFLAKPFKPAEVLSALERLGLANARTRRG